jgi:hypothetical protein
MWCDEEMCWLFLWLTVLAYGLGVLAGTIR